MNLTLTHKTEFKPNSSFMERESLINTETLKIMDTLRQKGFYPLEHTVTNKNDKTATITVAYRAQ